MKKIYQIFSLLIVLLCAIPIHSAATTVSADTLYYVDFNVAPATFTTGDYDIISVGSTGSKTVNGITFCGGTYGERIHIKTTATTSTSGNYSPATSDDAGANTGAISFIAASSGNAGGYMTLPKTQGPFDVTAWICGANTSNTQSYKVQSSPDGSTWTTVGTYSTTDRYIHKNVFSYTDTASVYLRFTCTTGSKSNANLYFYDVLLTQRPAIYRTSAIGTDAQTVSILANESINNIVYAWGGNATSASLVWTGTASSTTAPDGISVVTDATNKTVTVSGTPSTAGVYSYSITSTDGAITTDALRGTVTVVNTPIPLITLTSPTEATSQSILSGSAITDVQYTWSGSATSAVINWTGTANSTTPPDGISVKSDATAETLTISGTPTTAGTYGWSIYSTDGTENSNMTLTGALTVLPLPTISLTSATGTDAQTVSFFENITNAVYTYGGSATSATVTWSGTPGSSYAPAGITVTTNTANKTVTLSGAPMISGTYKYTITATYSSSANAKITGTITTTETTSTMLASFPGAVGYGAHATGGRGGSVYHVTNLDDSGTGSFRDAVSSSNRIVVFDVGGYINLKTAISAKSNLTIAGQTAPGGIAISGGELSFANSSNVICRDVRVRPGSTTVSGNDDALSLYLANNIMLDHCSFEFAPYNNIDGVSDNYPVHPVTGISFQNCLIADPEGIYITKLDGQQFGAHCESVISQWTFYRTVFANSHNRNPLAKINENFVNNVLYNCSDGYTAHTDSEFKHDLVNNYFVMGPASTGTDNQWFQVSNSQDMYYSGNYKDNNYDSNLDGSITTPYWYQGDPGGTVLSSPWSVLTSKIPTYDAHSAFRINASLSGAFPYDQMDSLIMVQVRSTGAGTASLTGAPGPGSDLYNSQIDTGLGNNGFGVITAGSKPTDTDGDGMPDYWETANGLNINIDEAMDLASDGYTNIEHYLNWLAEFHAVSMTNNSVDVDLSDYTGGFDAVSPTFTVSNASEGTATLLSDGHTVRFTPTADYIGLGGFTFTVTGTDATSYTADVSVLATNKAVSGIEETGSSTTSPRLYPNPAVSTLTVENIPFSSYEIINGVGGVVSQGVGISSTDAQTINVSSLPSGLYLIKLATNAQDVVLKFIKK